MVYHPFEGNQEEQHHEARPLPCPECESTQGYSRVGNYRVQCKSCNALLKNQEVDMELTIEEQR